MAAPISSGYLGDATGGIGQGLAFVLPDNKSAQYAMQLAQTHASQLQDMATQQRAQALKAQQQYESDFKSQVLPKAFAPYDKAIDKAHNDWQAKWAANYATTGKNPFNNPAAMAEYNQNVIEPARMSNELGQNYTKVRAIAETDPTNKYTKESKQAVIDYENKIKTDPMGVLNKPIPQLVENPATLDDLVKTLKPVTATSKTNDGKMETEEKGPDISNHRAQAFSSLLGDPKWHPLLQQYGYNPDLPDFGVYTDPKSPTGKRVWYTNPDFTNHQADLILEAPADPKNAKILATLGIHPDDQYAKEKLQHAITDQNSAMGAAVNAVGSRLDADVPQSKESKKIYTAEEQEFRRRSLANQERRIGDEEAWHKEKESGDRVSDAIYNYNSNPTLAHKSLDAISKLYQVNGAYNKPLQGIKIDGNTLQFTIPPKMRPNPQYSPAVKESKFNQKFLETQPAIPVSVNLEDKEQVRAAINGALKNVGGESNYNKYVGKDAHTKGDEKVTSPAPAKKAIKQSDISAKAKAAGYTEKEYTELLKKNGVKIE